MKQFNSGVRYYTEGVITISFPESDICCMHCPLMAKEYGIDRHYCKKTGEYLPAAFNAVGTLCPIKFMEVNENGENIL